MQMLARISRSGRLGMLCLPLFLAAGCGGGGSGSGGSSAGGGVPAPSTYSVTGTVTGLTGGTLVLQVNGIGSVNVSANGSVTLTTGLASGASYTVSVFTPPATPPQSCTVANASGTVAASNVSNVAIACAPLPPLSLVSSVPMDAAEDVDLSGPLVLTFSAPLSTTPAPRTTATLRADVSGAEVELLAGGVSGANFTLNHQEPLALNTAYTLTFSTDLRGTAGEVPAAPIVMRFTTRDGQWQEPVLIDSLAGDVSELDLAMNGRGDAMMVFARELSGVAKPHVVRYSEPSGWTSDFELASGVWLTGDGGRLQVSLDDDGNAFAAWLQENSQSARDLMARRYSVASDTWSSAEAVDVASASASQVDLGVDGDGKACVAWEQDDEFWVSGYDVATQSGWEQPEGLSLLVDDATPTSGPYVSASSGCSVAWSGLSTRADVWVTQEQSTNQWSPPTSLSPRSGDLHYVGALAGNAAGDAAVVWVEYDFVRSTSTLWVSRSRAASGTDWTDPIRLQTSNAGEPAYIAADMDESGNLLLVWMESATSGSANYQLWSARYTASSGWEATELLTDMARWVELAPSVVIDAAGNGLVAWTERADAASVQEVWARRHVPGEGWGPATSLDRASTNARNPRLAVDALGRAWAAWEQENGTGNADLVAGRFQ
jgi:Bacterial Ig-like domain